MKQILILAILFSIFAGCENHEIETDIAIIGGGASGVSAAIQAARLGKKVLIIEETTWLGGMLTSAGVSAIDGNHKMPSGIWGEFREKLYDYYGGPEAVFTGWVSNTQFEPSVGKQILKQMVADQPNISILYNTKLESAKVSNNTLKQVNVRDIDNTVYTINADIFIEATEYGDLLAAAGAEYDINMETKDETGEISAPEDLHPYVQDLTYVAILEDYGEDTDNTIPKPANYDPSLFDCMCKQVCSATNDDLLDCDFMLKYGKLPNNKYMINWPNKGNDYYAEVLEKNYQERAEILTKAKNETLSWIYFMQTEGGYTNLGISKDEFPTEDNLALIPYIRESRRVKGVDRLYLYDIKSPYAIKERPLYKTGIAVGDYPVDHHRKKNPVPKQIEFPKIPSYNVPYGVLVPAEIDGLIVAEKSISVSNVVNGTTRLQPVVLQIGQAAGAAAALSIDNNVQPRKLNVRSLQTELIKSNMWLMPYFDVTPDNFYFESVQRVGLSGVMRGEGIPVTWANETKFYPDSSVTPENLNSIVSRLGYNNILSENRKVTLNEVLSLFWDMLEKPDQTHRSYFESQDWFTEWKKDFSLTYEQVIDRSELAFLIDRIFDPFNKDQIEIGFSNPLVN